MSQKKEEIQMPIGVPRIIYCWGEELPAQWTDIYNFIFRRRMVFLMQYLDDELCNQICGLLINIHMEDRSKELEKKEMERSGVFKSGTKPQSTTKSALSSSEGGQGFDNKKSRSALRAMEDLLNADEDLGIDDIDTLEQYTLQKITTEWLNWNAQFFDYSDEPYLFYLAELLSKDFNKKDAKMGQNLNGGAGANQEISQLLNMLKNNYRPTSSEGEQQKGMNTVGGPSRVYSPFRTHANFSAGDFSLKDLNSLSGKQKLLQMFQEYQSNNSNILGCAKRGTNKKETKDKAISKLLSDLAQKDFSGKLSTQFSPSVEKALGQRNLRREYSLDNNFSSLAYGGSGLSKNSMKSMRASYLDSAITGAGDSYSEFRDYYRKQTERTLIEEESKKVFVIINSFGGSVGNGITVHDALQFIKAGSLTLALGVAASAASLALAGGTIGERYVTEGCHVMIHQPEGGLQGQASDIWIDSQEIMKIRLDVAEIYSLSTYRPRHKILRDLDRDFYLTATETIHYGLADEIATNEVMHEIIEMTSKVWDYHDSKQQRLLESRESANSGLDTQTQN
jgi:ATP-dependent Clp protease, protease subunit